jgi:hypothetical protein
VSGRDLVGLLAARPLVTAAALALAPLLALMLPLLHTRGAATAGPYKHFYAALVYLACIPGTAAAVLTAYALFFTQENLLDADWVVYLLPIVLMGATLALIRRVVSFDALPGFDRLQGLLALLAATFILVLALSRTRIWIVFGGSLGMAVVLAGALFALLKWGAHTAFRRGDEPRRKRPVMPGLD